MSIHEFLIEPETRPALGDGVEDLRCRHHRKLVGPDPSDRNPRQVGIESVESSVQLTRLEFEDLGRITVQVEHQTPVGVEPVDGHLDKTGESRDVL